MCWCGKGAFCICFCICFGFSAVEALKMHGFLVFFRDPVAMFTLTS